MAWKTSATFARATVVCALALTGCASSLETAPIVSAASLGRVIIYRNGVAYFERYAAPGEEEVTLRVPAERVDDFLKSLSVVDRRSGETMPVSYPTQRSSGGDVEMTIALPKNHAGLRITYVTESPAWKPSYRLLLQKDGKASLQGWAIVDNVSGEDWKQVTVGVGSTSALSFRYDLRSVREVARETLSSGSLLAVAPPTGGSPYGAPERARVLANLDNSILSGLAEGEGKVAEKKKREERVTALLDQNERGEPSAGGKGGRGHGSASDGTKSNRVTRGYYRLDPAGQPAPTSRMPPSKPAEPPPEAEPSIPGTWEPDPPTAAPPAQPGGSEAANAHLAALAGQLNAGGRQRYRVEGFAQDGDKDPRTASLERANQLRNALIDNGVAADRIDAVGTGELSQAQAARVVEAAGEDDEEREKEGKRDEHRVEAPVEDELSGQAHFLSNGALTIARGHSAMVSILDAPTQATRVYFYDPISPRGSKSYAFNAVRLKNPSRYTLDSGPFTVYVAGQFLGEGLSEPILPGAVAFIPYALDRAVVVEPEVSAREEIEKLLTIQRGIANAQMRQIRRTKLRLYNRGKEQARVYVRHKVADGYRLATEHRGLEKLAGAHLFPVTVAPGGSTDLVIEEWTPLEKSLAIQSGPGLKAIGLYLSKARLEPELKAGLEAVLEKNKATSDLEERMALVSEQMGLYRMRVDEINLQLVTLRKVPQAAKLRSHLSDKMEEVSNKLQDATIELSELRAKLMALRIDLQDKLAELTLERPHNEQKRAALGSTLRAKE
jgi:hypothetical protein